jgi:hypothetical protein
MPCYRSASEQGRIVERYRDWRAYLKGLEALVKLLKLKLKLKLRLAEP